MYVKDKMITDIVSIRSDASVTEAIEILGENKLHRLPVINGKGKLVGLLTASTIDKNTPNNSSSLSIYEINYMLNNIKVSDIMIKDVITISKDALLEEAAQKMSENDIGCLIVTNEDENIEGIITHKDIFGAFIDYLGYHQNGTRYTIAIPEDKIGVLNDISRCFKEINVSISHLVVDRSDRGIEVVVIAVGNNSNTAEDILTKNGYKVINIKVVGA